MGPKRTPEIFRREAIFGQFQTLIIQVNRNDAMPDSDNLKQNTDANSTGFDIICIKVLHEFDI